MLSTRRMATFPIELWIPVLDALDLTHSLREKMDKKATLYNISLVSRSLCAIAQPLLLEEVELVRGRRYQDKDRFASSVSGLVALFDAHPDIANRVLRLSISDFNNTATGPLAPGSEVVENISRIFVQMNALEDIVLQGIHLTVSMFRHFFTLHSLDSLILNCNTFEGPLPEGASPMELRVKKFTSLRRGFGTILGSASQRIGPNSFVEMSLGPHLTDLTLDDIATAGWDMMLSFQVASNFKYENLRRLVVAPPGRAVVLNRHFFPLLERCPNLTELVMLQSDAWWSDPVSWAPHPQLLSRLNRVEGFINSLDTLVPGRPVQHIKVNRNGDVDIYPTGVVNLQRLRALSQSSADVLSLHVVGMEFNSTFFKLISEWFPKVADLRIDFTGLGYKMWVAVEMLDDLKLAPNLQRLVLSMDGIQGPVNIQRYQLGSVFAVKLNEASKSLRVLSYEPGVYFKKRKTGRWTSVDESVATIEN